jgi:hypothetical protein
MKIPGVLATCCRMNSVAIIHLTADCSGNAAILAVAIRCLNGFGGKSNLVFLCQACGYHLAAFPICRVLRSPEVDCLPGDGNLFLFHWPDNKCVDSAPMANPDYCASFASGHRSLDASGFSHCSNWASSETFYDGSGLRAQRGR